MSNSEKTKYISPLSTRYSSDEMQYLFSEEYKFKTWRQLWIALAKAEKKLGLNISDEQVAELEANADNINFDIAEAQEKIVRHDVMSHVYAYGQQCLKAAGIIHLGATSCYVGDNTDIIILRDAAQLVLKKLVVVIKNLSEFADKYKSLPCLAYTHLQPAQLTTVGKRATLWIYELLQDAEELEHRIALLKPLGSKGTTGTQASFMKLFQGDEEKVKLLDKYIAESIGFDECVPVSGQTYSRKVDAYILSALSGIAQSAYKFSNDLRILQSFEEMEEPFENKQIGSSAMPYKRNPMRCERISALARYVIIDSLNPSFTAATQWFERTLDDSANKRLSVSEAFLAVDAILNIYINVSDGLVVYPKIVEKRVMEKLPYMATENVMMQAVNKGANRQELHESLRTHSHATAAKVRLEGGENDLIDRIANDPIFNLTKTEILKEMIPDLYIGRSISQTQEFISEYVNPLINKFNFNDVKVDLKV
ncbi:MAG: adenylosuccinate lyase [Clostridiales bacterium GWF2_38_85]|nr:MAG: adenylosuccinate lyase [Clostridiales bacterium GWF2_38_85]